MFSDELRIYIYRILYQNSNCIQPCHVYLTSSRQITEVKQRCARLVPGWVTTLSLCDKGAILYARVDPPHPGVMGT